VPEINYRADVWLYSPNLLKVKPYDFFLGIGDINEPLKMDGATPAAPKKSTLTLQTEASLLSDPAQPDVVPVLSSEHPLHTEPIKKRPSLLDDDTDLHFLG
jgi:hypothetical protein